MAADPADRVLAVNVAVTDARGQATLWRRGTTPPPEVAARLGAHVWASGRASTPAPTGARSGAVRRQPAAPVVPAAAPRRRDVFATPTAPAAVGAIQATPATPATPEHLIQAARAMADVLQDPSAETRGALEDSLEDSLEDVLAPQQDAPLTEPPRAGRGASAERWRTFAASLGQAVAPDASRDAVIALLEDAGFIDPL